jgi:hypothetical protein
MQCCTRRAEHHNTHAPCFPSPPLHYSRISPAHEVPPQPVPTGQGRHNLRGLRGHTMGMTYHSRGAMQCVPTETTAGTGHITCSAANSDCILL